MATVRVATTIRAPAERCFDLARSVSAHLSSMQTTRERVVTSVASDLLGPGAVVTWEATHFGARMRLMSKITQFDAPRSFEDEQIAGPFESFWHRHEFNTENGVTVMTDLVRYRSPFGFVGRLAEGVFLDRYLRALLERRAAHLRELAESGA
jgi:ligand-binding SRPBCC domain-containing protein